MKSKLVRILFSAMLIVACKNANAQWIQKANIHGPSRSGAVLWTLNNKLYIVGGAAGQSLQEYNPTQNTWTLKAALPWNTHRYLGVGFVIDNKGYICTGVDSLGVYHNDLWMYDPVTNAWSSKAQFPGPARVLAFAFSVNSKGYLGAGGDAFAFYNDMYEYDPVSNSWTQKSNFPGGIRAHVLGSALGNYGYAGAGVEFSFAINNFVNHSDLFKYDPAQDTWSPVSNIPGPPRISGVSFSSQGHLYAGLGGDNQDPGTANNYKDIYKYDPVTDLWDTLPLFPSARGETTGAFLAGKVYISTGRNQNADYKDLWSFEEVIIHPNPTAIKDLSGDDEVMVFPGVADDRFEIRRKDGNNYSYIVTDLTGSFISGRQHVKGNSQVDCSSFPNGIYLVRLYDNRKPKLFKIIVDHR